MARKKKRYLNFIATQYVMLRNKSIALQHWKLLQNYEIQKRRKMAGTLHFLYSSALARTFATLESLYGRKVPPSQVKNT